MKPQHFFNRLQHDEIVAAIRAAEKKTSGEIRVFISRHEPEDALQAAQTQFDRLGMRQTKEKNSVLIYVAPRAHRFPVVGDAGVHARCGDDFWRQVAAEMTGHFKKSEFTQGLLHGINRAGELLAEHFPRHRGDRNELPDGIAED